ncbi:hypothetical protein [Flavobacterium tibetense]|jgi:hypothetical protein|uniref:Uncharacterized protein n=1 Tax=Flavobacterium tibetense TaxID=2233533 RepID=A0A365P2T8_9FLAO|nr:hypothetical protein [Flavobacterium tibetense]RBA28854.1 hypothetical protein DPN68_05575 [Flavobacterium tibetense]
MNTNKVLAKKQTSNKTAKLILGILFDFIGMLSYLIPGIAETLDIVWAPISGFLLVAMYKGYTGKVAGIIGFLEEILPFTDVIPTFTLTWIYQYIFKKED